MNDEDRSIRDAGRAYLKGQRKELGYKTASLATNVTGAALSHGVDPTSLIGTIHGIQDVASNLRRQWHSADEEMSRAMREMNDLYRTYHLHHADRAEGANTKKSVKPSLKQVAAPVVDKAGGKFVSAFTNKDFIPTISGISSRLGVCEGKSKRIRTVAIYLNEKADDARLQLNRLEADGKTSGSDYKKIEKELDECRFSGKSMKRHGVREKYTVDGAIEKADDLDRQIAAAKLMLSRIKAADVDSNKTEIGVRSAKLLMNGLSMADGNFDIDAANPANIVQSQAGYGNPVSGVATTVGYLVKGDESRTEVEKAINAGKKVSAEQREKIEKLRADVIKQSNGQSNLPQASYQLPKFSFEDNPDGSFM